MSAIYLGSVIVKEEYLSSIFTLNKKYEVLSTTYTHFLVLDDAGNMVSIEKSLCNIVPPVAYTSYFSNHRIPKELQTISIARGKPEWFHGGGFIQLAPSWKNILLAKCGSYEEYIDMYYNEVLNKLDPKQIMRVLLGKVLLCYEVPTSFCHRHLASQWLREAGFEVVEWDLQLGT